MLNALYNQLIYKIKKIDTAILHTHNQVSIQGIIHMKRLALIACLLALLTATLSACAPAATTAAGIGGSTAVSHTLSGITYRTFTAPSGKVRTATLRALNRMGIKLVSDSKEEDSKIRILTARTEERKIEIQIEPISANSTRMRVVAKSSPIFYDSATAEEIIQQTKKSLG